MTRETLTKILEANPNLVLLSKTKLTARLKKDGVSKEDIDSYFNPRELNQVYAKPKKYQPLKITAPPLSFQMDVAFLPAYKKQNKGITAFLILVDIQSRKAFAYPLKSTKMADILDAYKLFLSKSGLYNEVNSVAGDDEFNNAEFLAFNESLSIQVYTDVAKDEHIIKGKGDKLGIVDRCIRTIKQYIQKYMHTHDDFEWTSYLDKLIELYNDTPNAGVMNKTPDVMYGDTYLQQGLHTKQKRYNKRVNETYDLKPGDDVRAQLGKGTFEKEKQLFSTEIYKIKEQQGYRFILTDEQGNPVKRRYRASELMKVDKSKVQARISKTKKADVEAEHKKVVKTRKGLVDKTYDQAVEAIAKKNEPKAKRTVKKVQKLDL
jgi:hypothetical protein